MEIKELRINGIKNPVGYELDNIICSWKVCNTVSTHPEKVRIELSLEEDFSEIILKKEGKLVQSGVKLKLVPKGRTRYYWRVSVWGNYGDYCVSEGAYFETGRGNLPWQATWIGPREEDTFHPVLFHDFSLKKGVKWARLYICGVGLFESFINGKRIGDEYLTPYVNDYLTGLQYFTFDIAHYLNRENKIQIYLGNGWYKGRFGAEKENFGNRFAAIAELHIKFTDGSEQIICTDENWNYQGSDIEESDIYDGEILNRLLWKNKVNVIRQAKKIHIEYPLIARYSLPIRTQEIHEVQKIIHTPKGETVLDFGQNMAGIVSFSAEKLPYGNKLILQFGEILQDGSFYNGNYRTAKATYTYISSGMDQEIRQHFTFFGFRYVNVIGWNGEISKRDFKAEVIYSDLKQTGYIKTANPKINRLFNNSMWSQKSNFLDMPTDCPQRDERLGWSGDICVFAATAGMHMDTRAFISKYLKDLLADQKRRNGITANYIPAIMGMEAAGSVWGDVATVVPYVQYRYFGNKWELKKNYSLMKNWVDSITRRDCRRGQKYLFDFGFHFGDWLSMDGADPQSQKGATEDGYIGTAYYYESTRLTAYAAAELGLAEENRYYADLAEKIRKAFLDEYVTATGRLAVTTQTAYLLSLRFGLYRDRKKIADGLRYRLEKDGYRIKGGFVGATCMCQVLAENGLEDIAYRLLLSEEYPSWLYCVNMGATTIWERWNSVMPDGKISGTGMNSLNHYAYGAVCEFLYRYTAGIAELEPGFRKISICPLPTAQMPYLCCSYNSVQGKIVSEWKIKDSGELEVHVEIPFDTTAILTLPKYKGDPIVLEAGMYDYCYHPDKDYTHSIDENTVLKELLCNEEAMRIIEKKLPRLKRLLQDASLEILSLSLKELSEWVYLGYDKAEINDLVEDLKKVATLLFLS